MIRVKTSLDHKRIRSLVWLVLTLFVLLGYSLQSAAGSAYYSMLMQNYGTVSTPPVILQNGTAGTSTIYANGTSAKVSVEAPLFDYIDSNDADVDSSADEGMHSNFPAQQAGPDSTYDELKEENSEAIEDYVDQQSDIDSSSDLGSHDIFNNLKAIDSTYDNVTEVEVGGEDTWEWSETVPGGYAPTYSYTDYIFASDFTPSSSYTATRIGIYAFANPQNNPDVKLAIYNQSAGEPDQVLGETAIFQITGSGWFDVDLTTPVELSSGVTYSVAHITEETPTNQWRYNEIATPVSDYCLLSSWPDFDEGADWTQSASYRYGAYRVGYTTGGDYQLDLEVQFTDVIAFLPTEKLCIYTGSLGDEDLRVDYWNGTGWENLATDLIAYSCNEYTVPLTSVNFTIRFKGGTESSDTTQDQWQIDASLLRVEGTGSKEDAVDQQSNVDGSADIGTHSNFTAQQYGPDLINDTLTEENIGIYSNSTLIDTESFEGTWPPTGWTGTGVWNRESDSAYDGIYSADFDGLDPGRSGDLDTPELNCSDATAIYVSFYFSEVCSVDSEFQLRFWDGLMWDNIEDLGVGYSAGWNLWEMKVTDSQYFISNFQVRWVANDVESFEHIYVDLVTIKKEFQSGDNYELDLEVQWTGIPYLLPNENLSIYGGTMGAEDLKVDVWNGTGWETIFTDLSSGWNNASITDWLTTSNFTIRFMGGTETGDANETIWQIDIALIHVWSDGGKSYELNLEVQWTGADYTRTNEELCIRTGTFSGSENIQVRVWNSTGSSWHWLMNLTASQWNNVSITSYLTSSTFVVQFLGGTETGDATQDSWNIDATLLHIWTGGTNWLGGWDKRVKITIDHNDVDSSLLNFPVLVYLSNSSGRNNDDITFVFDEVGSNSKKIAVTESDGTTQCYVEIEKWDDVGEQAWLWVKVPGISSTVDTDLYLYYDSSQSDNTAYVGNKESNPAQNVWDSSFRGVWHLDEDPSGTAPQMRDSTSNNNDGTSNGLMMSGDQVAGKVDGSLDFDGTDDYIQTPSNELQALENFTMSVWFKTDTTTNSHHILWEGPASENGWGDGSSPSSHEMHLTICKYTANNTLTFFYGYEESGNWTPAVEIITPFSDTMNWNHVVVVVTGAGTSPSAELFLNGVSQGTDTGTQTNRTAWDSNLRIGRPGAAQRYFDGMIDEVRILETAKSDVWIKASYESGRDDLIDFASEEGTDYVDNNTSDVGSPTDRGAHSNFTAQQYGPDLIYDTLTEENTAGGITYENSAESNSIAGQSSHNFNYSLQKGSGNNRLIVVTVSWEDATGIASVSNLTFGGTAITHIVNVTVGTGGYSEYISLWYLLDTSLPSSPGNYNIDVTVSEIITREIYIAVAEYSGVKQTAPDDFEADANTLPGDTEITLTAAADGSLVVAGVGEGGIYALTNTTNIDNLQEQVFSSCGSALGHNTNVNSDNITVGWNNLDVREGMAGAVWQPASDYELDLEVQWTNAGYTQANEELCIKTGTTGAEDIRVDVWNGSAWVNVFMDLTPNSWNNISVTPYFTSSNFTIRFNGGNETGDTNQDSWNIDATLLHIWTGEGTSEETYDYVLRVNNTVTESWEIRLKKYSDSSISRLQNCTIYFHNSTDGTSSQINIQDGSCINQTGPWYDLGDSETIYIAMTVQANSAATSYVYAYLEIRTPNTTTYAQYVITFEIT